MKGQRWICMLAVVILLLTGLPLTVSADKADAAEYTDNPVIIERLNRALEAFPVGSYFTYDGKPCSCHNARYCATEPYGCNCRRVVDGVDLYAWQCFGYARYVFYSCFGFLDTSWNESLYKSVGSTESGEMTGAVLQNLLSETKTGAHIRIRNRHSMIFLKTEDEGFYVLHGNYDNHCGIYITYYTWDAFIKKYNAQGIEYIKQPKVYPGEEGETDKPVEPDEPDVPEETELSGPTVEDPVVGDYRVTADLLYIRADAGTQYDRVGSLPQDTLVTVTAVKDGWGQVITEKTVGWISLEFAELLKSAPISLSAEWIGEGSYTVDGRVDAADVRVVVTYSDGSTALQNKGYELIYEFSQVGEHPVTVSCKGLTATLTATVKEADTPPMPDPGPGDDRPSGDVSVVPKGDVNGDNRLDTSDARLVLQYAVGKLSVEALSLEAADVDENQKVDSADARLILQMAVGKLPQPEQEDAIYEETNEEA